MRPTSTILEHATVSFPKLLRRRCGAVAAGRPGSWLRRRVPQPRRSRRADSAPVRRQETAVVTLRRSRRPERQMAAYQRHLMRMQKRRSSVAASGVESAAAAAAAAAAGGIGGSSEEAPPTKPPSTSQRTKGHGTRPKVVSHWDKTPGETENTGEKRTEKDRKEREGKKEKRKGNARRVSVGKMRAPDAGNKEQEKGEVKKNKTKKRVRMSEDEPDGESSVKTLATKSKWAGIQAVLKLWHREPVSADQLESVPVPGSDGEEHHITLRKPPPITLAFEGLRDNEELPSKLAEKADAWRMRAHASAAWPTLSAQLVASLLSEVVDEESAAVLQDELTDHLARRLVERVLDRAQLVAYNRQEHAEAVKHIFLSNMGNIVPADEEK